MKFLVDEDLPRSACELLRTYGHEAANVRDVGMRGLKTNLIVSFITEGSIFKIITSYPCKNLKKELKNKEGIRWVRIR